MPPRFHDPLPFSASISSLNAENSDFMASILSFSSFPIAADKGFTELLESRSLTISLLDIFQLFYCLPIAAECCKSEAEESNTLTMPDLNNKLSLLTALGILKVPL